MNPGDLIKLESNRVYGYMWESQDGAIGRQKIIYTLQPNQIGLVLAVSEKTGEALVLAGDIYGWMYMRLLAVVNT